MDWQIEKPEDPERDGLVELAIGFDIEEELALCKSLAARGGPTAVKEVFDGTRAARLFQGLLSTGRFNDMDEHWKSSIEAGVERGTLAPPEWN